MPNKQDGFSLIEVLVSITILSIISVSLISIFSQSLSASRDSTEIDVCQLFSKKCRLLYRAGSYRDRIRSICF